MKNLQVTIVISVNCFIKALRHCAAFMFLVWGFLFCFVDCDYCEFDE